MDELYNRILQMGLDRGYKNITNICLAANVKPATMTEYKKGRTVKLSLDTLMKFSALYGISVEQLISGEQKEKPTVKDDGLDPELGEIMSRLASASPEKRKLVLDLLKLP